MGAQISTYNHTNVPLSIKVFTTGRGFIVAQGMVNRGSSLTLKVERVWYDIAVYDADNQEVAKLDGLFCGSEKNGFHPILFVTESNGHYTIGQVKFNEADDDEEEFVPGDEMPQFAYG